MLLHLEPRARRSTLVSAALVLRHVALEAALDDLVPRLQAVRREPPHGEDQAVPGHRILKSRSPITKRTARQVATVPIEYVERHEQRGRGDSVGVRLTKPVEPGAWLPCY